ncbi:universal stress protein [Paraburkholderia jirisanensis]
MPACATLCSEYAMPKPSKILLYYDGTREAKGALHRAGELALALGAHADVLAVVDTVSAVAASGWYLSDLACACVQDAALLTLREALDHLEGSGVPVRGHMACGDVVDSISTHAGMLDSDILVVGHRTRTGLSRWWNRGVAHDHLMARCNGRLVVSIPCG